MPISIKIGKEDLKSLPNTKLTLKRITKIFLIFCLSDEISQNVLQFIVKVARWNYNVISSSNESYLGRSSGLVVMEGVSRSEGRGFES